MAFISERGASHASEGDLLQENPWVGPAILLVDLDAFFASVEQLDHPGWRGKPVIVGGDPNRRGVVSTASYEARRFGVRSAMASAQAAKLCPQAIWTAGHFSRYRELSDAVMAILRDETPHVRQVSIDEAFLDVTPTKVNRESPIAVAQRIQRRVEELGITCSIGLGTTKSIAKIASDMDKPRGLTVVLPGSERSFLGPLPIRCLSGIGPSAEKKLNALGIETLGDLHEAEDGPVIAALGAVGQMLLDRVRGREDATIEAPEAAKSISSEISFAQDFTQADDVLAALHTMAAKVGRRLRKKGLAGHTVTVKVRYGDLRSRTAQCRLGRPTDNEEDLKGPLHLLLDELWQEGVALRLVGVAVSGFEEEQPPEQLSLFDGGEAAEEPVGAASRDLQGAADKVKERFGDDALIYGRELRLRDSTTGSGAKNPADYR